MKEGHCYQVCSHQQKNYKKIFANKFNNLDEVDKCLPRYKLTKLAQEKIRKSDYPNIC